MFFAVSSLVSCNDDDNPPVVGEDAELLPVALSSYEDYYEDIEYGLYTVSLTEVGYNNTSVVDYENVKVINLWFLHDKLSRSDDHRRVIPEGTFVVNKSMTKYSCIPGYYETYYNSCGDGDEDEEVQEREGSAFYRVSYIGAPSDMDLITSGRFTITRADDIYTIITDLVTESGVALKYKYIGPLDTFVMLPAN